MHFKESLQNWKLQSRTLNIISLKRMSTYHPHRSHSSFIQSILLFFFYSLIHVHVIPFHSSAKHKQKLKRLRRRPFYHFKSRGEGLRQAFWVWYILLPSIKLWNCKSVTINQPQRFMWRGFFLCPRYSCQKLDLHSWSYYMNAVESLKC